MFDHIQWKIVDNSSRADSKIRMDLRMRMSMWSNALITINLSAVVREWFVQFVQPGSQIHGERRAQTYNGGLCLQWGSGVWGHSSPEADKILASKTPQFTLKSVRIGKKNSIAK